MAFNPRAKVVPNPLWFPPVLSVCIAAACLLHHQCPGGFGSCWLRLSRTSYTCVGLCQAILKASPAPCCVHYSQHWTLFLVAPYPCNIHLLNTLQMLLDIFLTHFLWSPCNLLCQNNCNLFKCQQATRGRKQLCARAEQLQGTGPILPLEQRSKLEERKRPFTSVNSSLTPPLLKSPCSFMLLLRGYDFMQE